MIVPAAHAKRAREVVAGLPVSKEEHPGVWQPGMTEADKRFWRRRVWLWLAVVGLGLLASLISIFRG